MWDSHCECVFLLTDWLSDRLWIRMAHLISERRKQISFDASQPHSFSHSLVWVFIARICNALARTPRVMTKRQIEAQICRFYTLYDNGNRRFNSNYSNFRFFVLFFFQQILKCKCRVNIPSSSNLSFVKNTQSACSVLHRVCRLWNCNHHICVWERDHVWVFAIYK